MNEQVQLLVTMNEQVQVYVNCPEEHNGAEKQVAPCTPLREADEDGYEELQDKLKNLQSELTEIKLQRKQDAQANEKVACMFATQEQNWIAEKKSLRRQIQALFAQFRVIEMNKEEMISSLNKIIEEKDQEMQLKSEGIEELVNRNKVLEEKVQKTEGVLDELNVRLTKETEDHSSEILKHKTEVAELVSNQHRSEADMGHAFREVESMKHELDEVNQQKDKATEAVERLSGEVARLHKDREQKDKILSAMLRKSKHDTAEKQVLLKEVKMSKMRRKQAELEAEQWRAACETRRRKGYRPANSFEPGCSYEKINKLQLDRNEVYSRALLLEYLESESRKDRERTFQKEDDVGFRSQCLEQSSREEDAELVMIDIKQLQDWIQTETEKCATVLEQRHYAEIEAFTEQMRVKDEKLEGLHWKFLSAELELKRVQSHIYDLEASLSQLQDEKNKVESLLLNKEMDLKSINDRFTLHVLNCRKNQNLWTCSRLLDPLTLQSEVKITRIPREQDQEVDDCFVEEPENVEKQMLSEPQHKEVQNYTDILTTFPTTLLPSNDHTDDIPVVVDGAPEEIGEEKVVSMDPGHINKPLDSERQRITRSSSWKVDINAMGISYKIKRLEQQLLVVEKLTARDSVPKIDKCDKKKTDEKRHPVKGFHHLMSLLNKQVKRYQALEEKANDLCKRMSEDERIRTTRDASNDERTCEQVETLERFLKETFQLQRYMVATGQKLMEIQSRITCSFMNADGKLDKSAGFNLGQFADIVRCLLREIQRGLEVRIARTIGDLEGILARDVITRF